MTRLVLVFLCIALSLTAKADKPNILFISVDDLNDWIGCLGGHPQAITPNLDRLAASGVLFTKRSLPGSSMQSITRGDHDWDLAACFRAVRQPAEDARANARRGTTAKILFATRLLVSRIRQDSATTSSTQNHGMSTIPPRRPKTRFPRTFYPEKRPVSLPRGGPWQYVETDWAALECDG